MNELSPKLNSSRVVITGLLAVSAALFLVAALLAGCAEQGGKLKPSTGTDTYDVESFTNIDADIDFGNITLGFGEAFRVTVDRVDYPQLEVELNENGMLTVGLPDAAGVNHDNAKCDVSITVPEQTKLSMIRLSTQSGTVKVNDIEAAYIQANATVGDIETNKATASSLDLTTVSGDVLVEGLADEPNLTLYLTTSDGTVKVGGEEKGKQFVQSSPISEVFPEAGIGENAPQDVSADENAENADEPNEEAENSSAGQDEATGEPSTTEDEGGAEDEQSFGTEDPLAYTLEHAPVIVNVNVTLGDIEFR